MDVAQAERIKESGLVLAQCERHGDGMPIVDGFNGHPIYGSAVEVLIGEVFEAALGHLIEDVTGIAGLTISPMHSGYAIHEGKAIGAASVEVVSASVSRERADLGITPAPDGTVTIAFSDIEDSVELNILMGDTRWIEILHQHNAIIRRATGLHRGFEVKSIGDAFMLAFQSAKDALNCAITIQRDFARRNESTGPPIRVRIGIHTGELVREQDDFYGRHVNYASRVGAEAKGGEVLTSSLLREVVEPSGEFTFQALPKRPLKGFSGKHALHSVDWSVGSTLKERPQ